MLQLLDPSDAPSCTFYRKRVAHVRCRILPSSLPSKDSSSLPSLAPRDLRPSRTSQDPSGSLSDVTCYIMPSREPSPSQMLSLLPSKNHRHHNGSGDGWIHSSSVRWDIGRFVACLQPSKCLTAVPFPLVPSLVACHRTKAISAASWLTC